MCGRISVSTASNLGDIECLLSHKLTAKTKVSYHHMNYQRSVPHDNVPKDYNSSQFLGFHVVLCPDTY